MKEALVEIVGFVARGMNSYWELGFRQFYAAEVVRNAFRKRSLCLADKGSRAESAFNIVNYVPGDAGYVFLDFVGCYLWRIFEDHIS